MIKVIIGTNTNRKSIVVDESTTVRSVLDEHEIDYGVGNIHLDGAPICGNELDRTFQDYGVTDKCLLVAVVKADGGM